MSAYEVGSDHAPRRSVRPHAVPRRPARRWRETFERAFDVAVFLLCMTAAVSLLWIDPDTQREARGASQEIPHD